MDGRNGQIAISLRSGTEAKSITRLDTQEAYLKVPRNTSSSSPENSLDPVTVFFLSSPLFFSFSSSFSVVLFVLLFSVFFRSRLPVSSQDEHGENTCRRNKVLSTDSRFNRKLDIVSIRDEDPSCKQSSRSASHSHRCVLRVRSGLTKRRWWYYCRFDKLADETFALISRAYKLYFRNCRLEMKGHLKYVPCTLHREKRIVNVARIVVVFSVLFFLTVSSCCSDDKVTLQKWLS